MTNADKFKRIFGLYATELWAKPEKEFLEWLNEDVPDTNVGDTISRRAAIDALDKRFDDVPMKLTMEILQLRKDLRELPSAQRKGKWIMHIDDLFPVESTMECSKCHHEQSLIIDDNFCPNCGAWMMKGESDDT